MLQDEIDIFLLKIWSNNGLKYLEIKVERHK
jgi:hypothetical protein